MTPLLAELGVVDQDWMRTAPCRGADPDEFVGSGCYASSVPARPEIVERLCSACPFTAECLAFGQSTRSDGWWGGRWLHHGKVVPERAPRRLTRRWSPADDLARLDQVDRGGAGAGAVPVDQLNQDRVAAARRLEPGERVRLADGRQATVVNHANQGRLPGYVRVRLTARSGQTTTVYRSVARLQVLVDR